MNTLVIVLLATAIISVPASAQQSAPTTTDIATQATQDAANGTAPQGKDRIGLTATQRQMIAWSIAGFADMQPVPPSFQPAPGTKVPKDLSLSQVCRASSKESRRLQRAINTPCSTTRTSCW